MKKIVSTIGILGVFGMFLTAVSLGGAAGCGSGGSSSSGTGSVTTNDVQNVGSASVQAALTAMSALGTGAALTLDGSNGAIVNGLDKDTIAVNQGGSLPNITFPTVTNPTSSVTINGSQIHCKGGSAVGSGSCTISAAVSGSSGSFSGDIVMGCTNLVVPVSGSNSSTCDDVNLDGKIGISFNGTVTQTGSGTTASTEVKDHLELSSQNLKVGLSGSTDDVVLAFVYDDDVTVSGQSSSGTIGVTGGVSVNGSTYTYSGQDTL